MTTHPIGHPIGQPLSHDDLVDELTAKFDECGHGIGHGIGWDNSRGQRVVMVPPEHLVEVSKWLRDERGFAMCVDVTSVDYIDHRARDMGTWNGERTRFEVVVNLLDLETPRRLRLRVPVPGEQDPTCPSLAFIWPSTDALEREVYDLMGVTFTGHPALTRILMPDEWEGHPLRKDYPSSRIPITFKDDEKRPENVIRVRQAGGRPEVGAS